MANLHLVTGYAGYEHIKATDQAAFNAALIGTGQFVLEKGGIFEAQVQTNNLVRVLDGELMMQGRFVRLDPDTYVDLEIENGEQGKLRNDIIVARYTKDIGTGVEECNLVVIKGESVASNPADPAHEEGDITNGVGAVHDFPLWRIPIDGINVGEPESLFGTPFMDSMHTLHSIREDVDAQLAEQEAQYETAMEEQNERFQKAIEAFGGYTKAETLTDETKNLFGLAASAVPDDVLKEIGRPWLAESAVYRWTEEVYSPVPATSTYTVSSANTTSSTTISIVYSDEIEMDSAFKPVMKNPESRSWTFGSNHATIASEINTTLAGKYIKASASSTDVYLFANATSNSVQRYSVHILGYAITMTPTSKTVSSDNPDAYPSGIVGFYNYIKLAPEFSGMSRYQTGSYFGTGTVSSSSPNTLAFDFVPKLVVVGSNTAPYYGTNSVQTGGATLVMVYGVSEALVPAKSGHYGSNKISWNANTVSWYGTAMGSSSGGSSAGASAQMNYSGVVYFYIAIG